MNKFNPGKKPFPWRCTQCREQAVYGASVDYTTVMHHDLREYVVKIDGLKTPKCAKCGQVMLDMEALGVLYTELSRQANILMPEQIHEYRVQSNYTVQELATALGIHEFTVANWDDGGGIQNRSLDNLLRLFFGLPQVRELLTTHKITTLPSPAVAPRKNNDNPGKKPFPWRCTKCREQAVYEATVDYTMPMHHEWREYTIKIDGLKTPKCAKCGQVTLDTEALGVLYAELRRQANILTPEQIHDYRVQNHMTQQELAAAAGVQGASVAGWESGSEIQQRSTDYLLRLFFGLPQVREILTTHQIGTLPRSAAALQPLSAPVPSFSPAGASSD
jgi:DNA-binding transcriptional regulator YiaG